MLKALEKHIPSARVLLGEAGNVLLEDPAEEIWSRIEEEKTDLICVYGLSAPFYALARPWLDGSAKRRLVFVEEDAGALKRLLEDDDAILLLNDLRVKIYFLESPLQIDLTAKKTAWAASFQELSVQILREGRYSESFYEAVKEAHLASHLLLSDAAEWWRPYLQNGRANRAEKCRSGMALKGAFQNVPAIVVGAGPSLEKNGHLLREFAKRGLVLAGGSALNVIDVEPHFAASVDAQAPYRQFKMQPFSEVPFCCQSRMNRDNFALIHGEKLLFPDSGLELLNWINGQEECFESGWTVGNFLTAFAVHLGCNPILFIGMDLCYKENKKYASLDAEIPGGLIQILDVEGRPVLTQRDWLMAARWTEEFAAKYPGRRFINATEGGVGFKEPVVSLPFSKVLTQLEERQLSVHSAIQSLPFLAPSDERWEEFGRSLRRCQACAENAVRFHEELLEGEIAYQKLLKPLWQIWRPLFERELDLDVRSIPLSEKIRLNQVLFFQQVIQEHLDAEPLLP